MLASVLIVLVIFFIIVDAFKRVPPNNAEASLSSPAAPNLRTAGAANPNMMAYRGGPIISKPQIVPIFAALNYPMANSLTSYYRALMKGNYIDFLSQYDLKHKKFQTGRVATPVTFNWSSPTQPLTQAGLEASLTNAVASGKIPTPNADTIYVLHFQGGFPEFEGGSCLDPNPAWCSTHTTFIIGTAEFVVAFIPDMSNSTCTGCAYNNDNFPITPQIAAFTCSSHEIAESMTDPDGNINKIAWASYSTGYEVGDYCSNRAASVVLGDGHAHPIQMLWSNKHQRCEPPKKGL